MKKLLLFFALLITFSTVRADVPIAGVQSFVALANTDGTPGDNKYIVNDNLIILPGGSINCNDLAGNGNAACNIEIIVNGNLVINGAIYAENRFVDGNGGNIKITVTGNIWMFAGSFISSSNLSATSGNKNAGDITIKAGAYFAVGTGATIKANSYKGKGGDILIEGVGTNDIVIDGSILSQSTGTGTGTNQGHGGTIFIQGFEDLSVYDNGIISSKGLDPGADLVHLCACNILIWGLVESTGHGHAVPSNPPNHLWGIARPDKPANSTAGIEIWASNTLVINGDTHKGQVNADLSLGAEKRAWIDIFSKKALSIIGKTTGTAFVVHSNVGGNNSQGGIITVKSLESTITANGMAIQANGIGSGVRKGGPITVHSDLDLNLDNVKMESKGVNLGGTIALRSFDGFLKIAGAAFNVSNTGTVSETSCSGVTGVATVTGGAVAGPIVLCGGAPFLQPYVTFCECGPQDQPCVTPVDCGGTPVDVTQNVTVDLSLADPTTSVPASLQPFFTYDKSGATPNSWKAIFTMGSHRLTIKPGFTLTTAKVNGYAPGITITSDCDVVVEAGGHIVVESSQQLAGDIFVDALGQVLINGEVRNETLGTTGMPGAITIKSATGIIIGGTGKVLDLGVDGGGNLITLVTCPPCTGTSDIVVNGLVMAYAHAHVGDLIETRPRIRVVALHGTVTVNATTAEPILDDYIDNGTEYDIYGGLLSWVRDNNKPGYVTVQASGDITVNGHGVDPTGPVRTSFGAIAAISNRSDAPGGKVDVRSLEGNIIATNRAFDVSGRNRLLVNYAHINLEAKLNIQLSRPGADNTFNPVVDASSPSNGDNGGKNTLRSYAGQIIIGANAVVSAAVPVHPNSTQGINLLTSCLGLVGVNATSVVPADLVPGDDIGACAPAAPSPLYIDCDLNGPGFPAYRQVITNKSATETKPAAEQPVSISSKASIADVKNALNVFPNPFMGKANINYTLARASHVTLEVYNALGKKVAVLVNAKQAAGTYNLQWNAGSNAGGSYYIHLHADKDANVSKVYLVK